MKKTTIVLLSLSLSGCFAPTLKNLGALKPVEMQEAEVMPTPAEISGARPRVVVFNAKDDEIALAQSANISSTIALEIEKHLGETGIELIDRSMAGKLQDELRLAEMKGNTDYQGPEVVDYAVIAAVSQATAGGAFQEATRWTDKKGRTHVSPAKCKYSAEVTGVVKIYKMPSMKPVLTLDLAGAQTSSEDARSSNCGMSQASAGGLVRAASTDAVTDARTELQNFFAPRGYVLERRSDGATNAFKISMGKDHGLQQGSKLMIMNSVKSFNALTKKETVETYTLTEAEVTEQLGADFAWIVVDKEAVDKVRFGHEVKSVYEKGIGDVWRKLTR